MATTGKSEPGLFRLEVEAGQKADQMPHGYTLLELVVTLSVLSLLTVTMAGLGLGGHEQLSENAFAAECEKILYTLLQYQNEAIMDGCPRKIRFLDKRLYVTWTKDGISHQELIPVETLCFSGDYRESPLTLKGSGTVSAGGTVNLTGPGGIVRKIIVQPGNGRIYLDEP